MRILLSLLFIGFTLLSNAQTRKQLKHHKASLAASRKNQTPLVSLDSFYCSGVKLATVKNRDAAMNNIVFRNLKTGDTMIFVTLVDDADSIEPTLYYNYYFPTLQSSCDVVVKEAAPQSTLLAICKQGLLNTSGLDTFKAETFVALKGSTTKKREAVAGFRMPVRNKSAAITVRGHDIYQDTVIVGSFEETTITGPGGVTLKQVQVYNTQKRVICFSTEVKPDAHEWRTVTNKDGKYHTVRAVKSKEGDLYEIIRFLISGGYL